MRVVVVVVALCILLLVARAAVTAFCLIKAQSLAGQLQAEVADSHTDALAGTGEQLAKYSAIAAWTTSDITWRATELIPVAGPNLFAVRMLAETVDDVVGTIAVPVIGIVTELDAADPVTGGVNFRPVKDFASVVESAEVIIPRSITKLTTAADRPLIEPLSKALTTTSTLVTHGNTALAEMGPFLKIASQVIGQDGTREYLLAFQNNAETTALGGSAASFTKISVTDGQIAVSEQAGSGDFGAKVPIDVPVDQSAVDLYGPYLLDHLNTSTSRPDFPTAARIMQGYWLRDRGTVVDGVISVDPLALALILKATGPVTLPSGDVITSDNGVQLLLSDIYARYDSYLEPEKVDGFFQGAAMAILNKVTIGEFDMDVMVTSLTDAIDQGSLLAWSADPAEQEVLLPFRIAGALPSSNVQETVLGVYYRDTSMSKIDYYLETGTRASSTICTSPTDPTFTLTVTLRSNLTMEAAIALPRFVKSGIWGAKQTRTEIYIYGPIGATVAGARVDSAGVATEQTSMSIDLQRPVAAFAAYLAPGQTTTVTATFDGAPGDYGPIEVRGTPMINATDRAIVAECE